MTARPYQQVLHSNDLFISGKSLTQSDGSRAVTIPASGSVTVAGTFSLIRAQTASKGERLDSVATIYRVTGGTLASAVPTLTRIEHENGVAETVTAVASTVATAFGLATSANMYRAVENVDTPAYDNDVITQSVSYNYSIVFTATSAADVTMDLVGIEYLSTADFA